MKIPETGDIWLHIGGKEYAVDRLTINATTGEHDVVYYSVDTFQYYTRSLANFMGFGAMHHPNFTLVEGKRMIARRAPVVLGDETDVV